MSINQQFSFAGVRKCLSDLKKHFEDFCKDELNKINPKGKKKKKKVLSHYIRINSPLTVCNGSPLHVS